MKIKTTRDAMLFFQSMRPVAQAVFDELNWTEEKQLEYRRSLGERSGTHMELMVPRGPDHRLQAAGELLNILGEISLLGLQAMTDPGVTGKMMALAFNAHRAHVALNRDTVKKRYGKVLNKDRSLKPRRKAPTTIALKSLLKRGHDSDQIAAMLDDENPIGSIDVTVNRDVHDNIESYEFFDIKSGKTTTLKTGSLPARLSQLRREIKN